MGTNGNRFKFTLFSTDPMVSSESLEIKPNLTWCTHHRREGVKMGYNLCERTHNKGRIVNRLYCAE
jgi:hypothetical protein